MLKPEAVKVLPKYKLWIKYSDGVEGEVDLSHLVGKGIFSLWEDETEFQKVSIANSGEIVWNDKIDLCPDSLYMQITGKTPEQVFPKLKQESVNA